MRLIMVADIYGYPSDVGWLSSFELVDRLTLGSLCGKPLLNGVELHDHLFEQGGMQEAVTKLCNLSGHGLLGLGFSAGGTALWRAVNEGLPLKVLVCVSSTRLRYERNRLAIPTHTLWGELDSHRPDEDWCSSIPDHSIVYKGLDHDFYAEKDCPSGKIYKDDIINALRSGGDYV